MFSIPVSQELLKTVAYEDIHNPDDLSYQCSELNRWAPAKEAGLYIVFDHGFTVAAVFAHTLQDALDELADNDKLDCYKVSSDDLADYDDPDCLANLGGYGDRFDTDTAAVMFCRLYHLNAELFSKCTLASEVELSCAIDD